MKSIPLLLLPLVGMLFSGTAHSAVFKSVGAAPAILYDAPSARAQKLFVAPSGMPLEVVLNSGAWSRVRDVAGDFAWVEAKALVAKRTLVARSAGIRIHASANDNAAIVFGAERGVMLDLLEGAPSGWVKVRHRDGANGFARAADVWGD
jgi:SH3-like domain-containing protein